MTPYPAATVILVRDGARGPEVLLVRRAASLSFHGGAWVFPGGRIDEVDRQAAGAGADIREAARRAAVREAREEAGLVITADALVPLSRWITPEGMPRRFDTWFFAAPAGESEVHVDGGEIDAHRWMRPEDALASQVRSEIELPPPTYVTLSGLIGHADASAVLEVVRQRPFRVYEPRLCVVEGGACTLYAGDAGYECCDPLRPGPRHRLWILDSGWRYECDRRG